MRERWERFAREDAEAYICTGFDRAQGAAALEAFFASGREAAARILDQVSGLLAQRGRCLEIGCGAGRLLLAMAAEFDEALGVDVAPTMLAKLRANAREQGRSNVRAHLVNEEWDRPAEVDLAYSWLCFQHVEKWSAVAEHVRRVGRCLRPGGVAYLQFDTRPASLPYRARTWAPAFLLPRTWRPGIRRIRRDPELVRAALARADLQVASEHGADGDQHVFVARRV